MKFKGEVRGYCDTCKGRFPAKHLSTTNGWVKVGKTSRRKLICDTCVKRTP